MSEWEGHVKATPVGMLPVLINGFLPAYQVAGGKAANVKTHFVAVAPFEHWPEWAKKEWPNGS